MKLMVLISLALSSPASAGSQAEPASSQTRTGYHCIRQSVTLSALPAELIRLQGRCPGRSPCARGVGSVQNIIIGQVPTYLLTGQPGDPVDVTSQNTVIANANARAQNAQPPSKTLLGIHYFHTVSGGFTHLNASASYGICGPAANTQ